MSPEDSDLARLRREIDRLDEAIHDLIVERTAVVEQVGALKAKHDAPVLRPGREAEVLRRLVGRHAGAFPAAALVRIWRELMSASSSIQGPLELAVYAPGGDRGFCEMARAQFGSIAALSTFSTPGEVIGAVTDGKATVGIVPAPSMEDETPWWRILLGSEGKVPQVVARLPFAGPAGGADADLGAMALAFAGAEATGRDLSLFIVETEDEVSRAAIQGALQGAGITPSFIDSRPDGGGGRIVLVEMEGLVGADDPRLEQFAARIGVSIRRILNIGAYPAPFDPTELESKT